MTLLAPEKILLFEPWSLGDALIAAQVASMDPQKYVLGIAERWHPLIRYACKIRQTPCPEMISVNCSHTLGKNKPKGFSWFWESPLSLSGKRESPSLHFKFSKVVTPRGDLRDSFMALKTWGFSRFNSSGYFRFLARRNQYADQIITRLEGSSLSPRNRYLQWCDLLKIPEATFRNFVQGIRSSSPHSFQPQSTLNICIHIGAQWPSKTFPSLSTWGLLLEKQGHSVQWIKGPGDSTQGFESIAHRVLEFSNEALIHVFLKNDLIIAHDSGPLHLAGFLGLNAIGIYTITNPKEWCPLNTEAYQAPFLINHQNRKKTPSYYTNKVYTNLKQPLVSINTAREDQAILKRFLNQ